MPWPLGLRGGNDNVGSFGLNYFQSLTRFFHCHHVVTIFFQNFPQRATDSHIGFKRPAPELGSQMLRWRA